MIKFNKLLILIILLAQSIALADDHSKYESVMEYINSEKEISIFSSLLTTGYLNKALRTGDEYTIFAFTNDSYERLPNAIQNDINTKAYRSWRARMLTNHIIDEAIIIPIKDLPATVTTLSGNDLTLSVEENTVIVNNARILNDGIKTKNGIVYIVDSIIIP